MTELNFGVFKHNHHFTFPEKIKNEVKRELKALIKNATPETLDEWEHSYGRLTSYLMGFGMSLSHSEMEQAKIKVKHHEELIQAIKNKLEKDCDIIAYKARCKK